MTGQPFIVTFTNQGDNDEFDIKVTLRISRDGGTRSRCPRPSRSSPGQKATVELPLDRQPPLGTAVDHRASTVATVPGEKKTDNNKSKYPSLFARG